MKLKNLSTGEIEFMRYDPSVAAVQAGTHEHVSDEGREISQEAAAVVFEGNVIEDAADASKMTKEELRTAAAEKGVEVKSTATKAEIADAIKKA